MAGNGIYIAGGIGLLAYLTREKWMPEVYGETSLTTGATGATGNNPTAPTYSTGIRPIGAGIPGAQQLGNGCYSYPTGTDGSMVVNCPPGFNPPPAAARNNCAEGFTQDAGGICTRYPDSVLLANLNSIPWTGLSDIPSEQINRKFW